MRKKKDLSIVKYALLDGMSTKAVWEAFDRIELALEVEHGVQQLKAEIAALIPILNTVNTVGDVPKLLSVMERMRQISAV